MSHLVRRILSRIPAAWYIFLLALVAYGFAAGPTLARQSIAPHYVYLADALLHGHLDVPQTPSSYDMLMVDGRAYVAHSPMPAFMLMPFVAVFGAGFSDILFSVVVGALNVALVYTVAGQAMLALARKGGASAYADTDFGSLPRRLTHPIWLALLFALGTPHLYLAVLGSSWFTAHVVAIFFGLLAVHEALIPGPRRWLLSSLWLACAGFSRPSMLFGALFFVVLIGLTLSSHDRLRAMMSVAAAIAIGVSAHAVYNAARFGSPTDFGYQYVVGAPNITSAYLRYGGFNPRFLPCNLFVSILNPPEVQGSVPPALYGVCGYLLDGVNLSDPSAPITPNPLGMSLFIVTPAFFMLIAARRNDPIILAAWVGLLAIMIPLWMYHNTGSLQFGYRYWMDAAPMWLLLLVEALRSLRRGRCSRAFAGVAIVASIGVNVWGFLWMFERFNAAAWIQVIRGG
jgi:hypothetical protein